MAEDVEYSVSIAPGHIDASVWGVCCADCNLLGFYSGGQSDARGHGWTRHVHAGWLCGQCTSNRLTTISDQAMREEMGEPPVGAGVMIEMGWGYR